jgi:hypothetical protein
VLQEAVVPHIEPGSGTFTYRPGDGRWWWSEELLHLFRGDGPPERAVAVRDLVEECLRSRHEFLTVLPLNCSSANRGWALWTGEPVGDGDDAHVSGRVVDVTATILRVTAEQTATHVAAALSGRQVIDLVKGALMSSYGVDSGTAFELLVWCSQRTNVRVHDLSERVAAELARGAGIGGPATRDALERALVDGLAAVVTTGGDVPRTPLTLQHSSAGGARVLAVSGTVDLGSAPRLARELAAHLDELRAGDVLLLDLSEVDHLGPAGVWVVESWAR